MKLERKFLIKKLPPEVSKIKSKYIRQGYITREEDKEVRIRQKGRNYSLTIKSKGFFSREENNTQISKSSFLDLWPSTSGARVEKERRTIPYGAGKLVIDSYLGPLKGLITGEGEFQNLQEAQNFTPPTFFNEELTFDNRFKNKNLSILTAEDLEVLVPLKNPGDYPLIGVIPYTFKKKELQLMLITTRSNGLWIFPKGQPMADRTNDTVAQIEAFEEAGIKGNISGHPIIVPYEKSKGHSSMILYPMEISKTFKSWPESNERLRKIMRPEDAAGKLSQPGLIASLEYLRFINFKNSRT